METAESAEVQEVLHLAVAAGEGVLLTGDEVVGTTCYDGYYWANAMGYSTTPPRKSVKFWYSMNDWMPENSVNGNLSKTS